MTKLIAFVLFASQKDIETLVKCCLVAHQYVVTLALVDLGSGTLCRDYTIQSCCWSNEKYHGLSKPFVGLIAFAIFTRDDGRYNGRLSASASVKVFIFSLVRKMLDRLEVDDGLCCLIW